MKKISIMGAAIILLASVSAYADHHHGGKHFDKIDADHNGELTREEMTKAATERASKHFDHVDENKDGVVSKEEMKASKDKFKQKWRKHKKGHPEKGEHEGDEG
jgi:Ca2+-binding EF-hand superfamily protein